jgi:iron only hydrogenase large subunit-like protein
MNAVKSAVGENYTVMNIDGLDKKNKGLLKSMLKNPQAQFVEVMACEGGCLNGPCSLAPYTLAKKYLQKFNN